MKNAIGPVIFGFLFLVVFLRYKIFEDNRDYEKLKGQSTYARHVEQQTPHSAIMDKLSEKNNYYNYMAMWNMLMDMKNQWLFELSLKQSQDSKDKLNEDHAILERELEQIMNASFIERSQELRKLRGIINKKIDNLQNPKNCGKARFAICDARPMCGFGCYTHMLVNCLMRSFESGRVMVLYQGSKIWRYAEEGWEYSFLPVTKCKPVFEIDELPSIKSAGDDEKLVSVRQSDVPLWTPWTIPAELSPTILPLHGDPFAWWIAQFLSYMIRPVPWLIEDSDERTTKLGIHFPIAGIQIRRGDKLAHEAAYHSVDEYMFFVEQWYRKLQLDDKNITKRVFLATVDTTVLPELEGRYPDYEFIVNNVVTKKQHRYGHNGLTGVIQDLDLLSRCDYLVCTLSSSVCRTAYEMMMNRRSDASTRIQSVDMPYRFKLRRKSTWRAILDHTPRTNAEIGLLKGDELLVLIDAFESYNNGLCNGTNLRTKMTGTFPIFKVRNVLNQHSYPLLQGAFERV